MAHHLERPKEEHAGGMLSLIGVKVDQEGNASDILERTVKREICEEVGVKVKAKAELHYVHSTSFVTEIGGHVIDVVFLAELDSGEAFQKSPDEVEVVMWLTNKEIMEG